jgi:hypothetical protein
MVDEDRLRRRTLDAVLGRRTVVPENEHEAGLQRSIEREVAEMRAKGMVVDYPPDLPGSFSRDQERKEGGRTS